MRLLSKIYSSLLIYQAEVMMCRREDSAGRLLETYEERMKYEKYKKDFNVLYSSSCNGNAFWSHAGAGC